MNTALLGAIQPLIKGDAHPIRQQLFDYLKQQKPVVALVHRFYELLGGSIASTGFVALYGLKEYLAFSLREGRREVIGVAIFPMEYKQLDTFSDWVGRGRVGTATKSKLGLLNPGSYIGLLSELSGMSRGGRWFRALHRINRKHDFLTTCRLASAMAWYLRGRATIAANGTRAVMVSSDHNPEALGFAAAARGSGLSTIYLSRAHTTGINPRLRFSLAVLDGEAALEAYREKGEPEGRVVFRGCEGESKPMDAERWDRPEPRIGIFAPKAVEWPAMAHAIAECRRRFDASKVVVRWHPNMMGKNGLEPTLREESFLYETPVTMKLEEVAAECDWAIVSENSNAALQLWSLGVPVAVVAGLTAVWPGSEDLYGFTRSGMLPEPCPIDSLSVEGMKSYYGEDFSARLRRYDPFYLQPAAHREQAEQEIKAAIEELLDGPADQS